jgi:hypothetical protein
MRDVSEGWVRFFRVAAAYNVAVGLPFLVAEGAIREFLGMTPAVYPIFSQMLFAFVVLLGWGYWMVAEAPERNRDIVKLGVAGKLVAAALCIFYAATGAIPVALAAPGVGDLVFVAFFVKYLRAYPEEG